MSLLSEHPTVKRFQERIITLRLLNCRHKNSPLSGCASYASMPAQTTWVLLKLTDRS